MKIREQITDAGTGKTKTRTVEMAGVVSVEEALAIHAEAQRIAHNEAVIAEMDAADLKALRALLDGDTARIEAHRAAQAERRKLLR